MVTDRNHDDQAKHGAPARSWAIAMYETGVVIDGESRKPDHDRINAVLHAAAPRVGHKIADSAVSWLATQRDAQTQEQLAPLD